MVYNCLRYVILKTLLLISIAGFSQLKNNLTEVSIKRGDNINLQANSLNTQYYQWFKDGNIISGATSSDLSVSEAGSYTVMAFNTVNCSSSVSDAIIITVVDNPSSGLSADLSIQKSTDQNKTYKAKDEINYTISVSNKGPDVAKNVIVKDTLPKALELKEITPVKGVQHSFNYTSNVATWEIKRLAKDEKIDLNIIAKAILPGQVVNKATIESETPDPDLSNNESSISIPVYGIKIPNVFTPNHDGKNDFFEIIGLENYPDNELTILNRWGNHVFEQKPYKGTWKGDGLNEATYFYVLRINDAGQWQTFKGFVTLIRDKK